MRSAAQIQADLLSRPPPGKTFPREPSSNWGAMLAGVAAIWAQIEASSDAMPPQVDPRAATQFLGDYLRVLGPWPGDAVGAETLPSGAQAILAWERWTQRLGERPSDYEALAAQLGQTITIETYTPARCGAIQCGAFTPTTPGIEFYWTVTLAINGFQVAQCGAFTAGQPIGTWEPNPLVEILQAAAPAHTILTFTYTT